MLTAVPVASVALVQLCIIEMRACMVEDFGMAPNWSRSVIDNIAELMYLTIAAGKFV